MRFAGEHYRLNNIALEKVGNNLTIHADVELEPSMSDSAGIGNVGNISVTVMDYEKVKVGEGELTMHREEYKVFVRCSSGNAGKIKVIIINNKKK